MEHSNKISKTIKCINITLTEYKLNFKKYLHWLNSGKCCCKSHMESTVYTESEVKTHNEKRV